MVCVFCFDFSAHIFGKHPGDGKTKARGAFSVIYRIEPVEEMGGLDFVQRSGRILKKDRAIFGQTEGKTSVTVFQCIAYNIG